MEIGCSSIVVDQAAYSGVKVDLTGRLGLHGCVGRMSYDVEFRACCDGEDEPHLMHLLAVGYTA
jgi:hypothetical protein